MILGMGIDVAELDRIERGLARFGQRYLERILIGEELERLPRKNPVPSLAARFAAKEAASKALGTGFSHGVSLATIEVTGGERGQPHIRFHGAALERFQQLGGETVHVSLTHGRDVAAAVVVIEGTPPQNTGNTP